MNFSNDKFLNKAYIVIPYQIILSLSITFILLYVNEGNIIYLSLMIISIILLLLFTFFCFFKKYKKPKRIITSPHSNGVELTIVNNIQ